MYIFLPVEQLFGFCSGRGYEFEKLVMYSLLLSILHVNMDVNKSIWSFSILILYFLYLYRHNLCPKFFKRFSELRSKFLAFYSSQIRLILILKVFNITIYKICKTIYFSIWNHAWDCSSIMKIWLIWMHSFWMCATFICLPYSFIIML